MVDLIWFFLKCVGICFIISAVAMVYMMVTAEPFPYDEEDW